MEEPSVEWQIQEYSSEENSDGVSGFLKKGLQWGKKILVTGVVVSSAPLVLPPLVVISTVGLICSIPFGVFVASYACTEKLMSRLLPGFAPAPLLGLRGLLADDEQVKTDEEVEWQIGGLEEDFDLQKHEQELAEDKRQGVEAMIELWEKKKEEPDRGELLVEYIYENVGAEKDLKEDEYQRNVGENVDENYDKPFEGNGVRGVVENEPAIEERRDKGPVEEVCGVVIGIEVDENKGSNVEGGETRLEVTDIVVELCQSSEIKEDKELVRETKGLIEQLKDEGKSDNVREEDKQVDQKGAHRSRRNSKKSKKRPEVGYAENVATVPNKIKPTDEMGDFSKKKNVERRSETDKSVAETSERKKVGGNAELDPKPVTDKAATLQREQTEKNAGKDTDMREITDESGLDLLEGKNEAARLATAEGEHESTVISLEKDIDVASDKVLYSEEKIWEQIHAMRAIVGCKATPQESFVEELKALYLFTGVEPPSSFINPSDLVEVNGKLRFLMSIVGVK